MTDRSHIPMTSQALETLPLNVLMTLCGCCKCSAEERGARFRTMASPILEPPPSSEVGVLAAVSFTLLWLLLPEVKECAKVKQKWNTVNITENNKKCAQQNGYSNSSKP